MKFYEVMSQIVLTSHLVGFDLLSVNMKTWSGMSPASRSSFQAAVDKAIAWSAAEHLKREAELADEFREAGPRDLHPRRQRVPRQRAEDVSGLGRSQGLAGRVCSKRSTR